jgi:membrane protease YdiL (CAAX protease family)
LAPKVLLLWESLALFAAGLFGAVCATPYILHNLGSAPSGGRTSPRKVIISQISQNSLLLAIAIPLGLSAAHRTGLGAPVLEALLSNRPIYHLLWPMLPKAMLWGILTALIILLLDSVFFAAVILRVRKSQSNTPIWQYLLASFYGGINEEILTRLFLLSALLWFFLKTSHTSDYPSQSNFWIANLIVSAVFGIGHLGLTRAVMGLTPLTITRALALNGVAGIIFGCLYWRYGLEAAMLAHVCADLIVLPIAYLQTKVRQSAL